MFRPSADSHGTIRIRIRTSPLPLALLPRVRAAVPVAVDRTRTVTTLLSVFFLVLLAANGVHSRPSPTPVVTITSLNVDDTSPCDSAKQLRVQLWEREVTNDVETQEWILIEYDVYHGGNSLKKSSGEVVQWLLYQNPETHDGGQCQCWKLEEFKASPGNNNDLDLTWCDSTNGNETTKEFCGGSSNSARGVISSVLQVSDNKKAEIIESSCNTDKDIFQNPVKINVTPSPTVVIQEPTPSSTVPQIQVVVPSSTVTQEALFSSTAWQQAAAMPSSSFLQEVTPSSTIKQVATPSSSTLQGVTPTRTIPHRVTPSSSFIPSSSTLEATPPSSIQQEAMPSSFILQEAVPSIISILQAATPSSTILQEVMPSSPIQQAATPSSSIKQTATPSISTQQAASTIQQSATPILQAVMPSSSTLQAATPSSSIKQTATPSISTQQAASSIQQAATPIIMPSSSTLQAATPSSSILQAATPSSSIPQAATPSSSELVPTRTIQQAATPSSSIQQAATPSSTILQETTPSSTAVLLNTVLTEPTSILIVTAPSSTIATEEATASSSTLSQTPSPPTNTEPLSEDIMSLASQDPAMAVEQVEELLLGHQISSTDALQVLLLIMEQENETSIQMEKVLAIGNTIVKHSLEHPPEDPVALGSTLLYVLDWFALGTYDPSTELSLDTQYIALETVEVVRGAGDGDGAGDGKDYVVAIQRQKHSLYLPMEVFSHLNQERVRVASFLYHNLSTLLPTDRNESALVSPVISSALGCGRVPCDRINTSSPVKIDFSADRSYAAVFSDKDEFNLRVIGILCVSLSLLCLVATSLSYACLRSLWDMRSYAHVHLCATLFCAQLLFLVGVEPHWSQGVCAGVAVSLLYLYLVAFMWMLVEGLVLCVELVKVFVEHTRRYLLLFTAIAYGVPLVYVSVVGPVGFMVKTDGKWQFGTAQAHWLKVVLSLVVVMGLTWALGVLVFDEKLVSIAYIFTIAVALQGVIIFALFVVLSKRVRSAYLRCLENYLTTSFFGATRAARPGAEAGDLGIFTGAVEQTNGVDYEMQERKGSASIPRSTRRGSKSRSIRNAMAV